MSICVEQARGEKTRIFGVKSFWLPLLVLTALAAALSAVIASRRADLHELRRREVRVCSRLREVLGENLELRARRDALLSDPAYIERVAREEYGFCAPGEYLVPFKEDATKPSQTTVSSLPAERWDSILGRGQFPWRIPAVVFGASFIALACVNVLARRGTDDPGAA